MNQFLYHKAQINEDVENEQLIQNSTNNFIERSKNVQRNRKYNIQIAIKKALIAKCVCLHLLGLISFLVYYNKNHNLDFIVNGNEYFFQGLGVMDLILQIFYNIYQDYIFQKSNGMQFLMYIPIISSIFRLIWVPWVGVHFDLSLELAICVQLMYISNVFQALMISQDEKQIDFKYIFGFQLLMTYFLLIIYYMKEFYFYEAKTTFFGTLSLFYCYILNNDIRLLFNQGIRHEKFSFVNQPFTSLEAYYLIFIDRPNEETL